MGVLPMVMTFIVIFGFFEAAHAGGAGPDLPSALSTGSSTECETLDDLDASDGQVVERLYGFFTVFKHPIGAFGNTDAHFSVHIKLERGHRDENETGLNQHWFSFPTNVPTNWLPPKNLCKVKRSTIKTLYKLFPCTYGFLEPFNLLDPGPGKILVTKIGNLHIIQRDCQRPDGTQMIRGHVVIKVIKIDDPAPPAVSAVKK